MIAGLTEARKIAEADEALTGESRAGLIVAFKILSGEHVFDEDTGTYREAKP